MGSCEEGYSATNSKKKSLRTVVNSSLNRHIVAPKDILWLQTTSIEIYRGGVSKRN